MQAIVTKYLGPTDHRGARIKARCDAATITIPWDDSLDVGDNHQRAATKLAHKLGWLDDMYGRMVRGSLPDAICGGYCFVFTGGK